MWIVTTFGFFSAVEKPEDRSTPFLTVRARVRKDLVELLSRSKGKRPKILDDKRGDYRYRARIRRGVLARIVADELLRLDYSNFKDEVRLKQGPKREGIYHRVWENLAELQPTRPYAGRLPLETTWSDRWLSAG
ncbi:MAG: hypothetical protein KGL39_40360 [Patescibacteria group bacterium]|nr:hypothetical protein [Patescibacteria group bacterium]